MWSAVGEGPIDTLRDAWNGVATSPSPFRRIRHGDEDMTVPMDGK